MRHLIAAAIATFTLQYACNTVMVEESIANNIATGVWVFSQGQEIPDRALQDARYRAWMDLCFEYRAEEDCTGIKVPKVKQFPRNPFRPGLAGYYDGSDTVYIRQGMKYDMREEVLAHEMSHYLDKVKGYTQIPGPALDVCFSEKRAWRVSDLFWIKQGYAADDKRIVGHKWVEWYGHCTPHKAELYPDVYGS